jgi:hypothetical protein
MPITAVFSLGQERRRPLEKHPIQLDELLTFLVSLLRTNGVSLRAELCHFGGGMIWLK